MIAMVRSTDSEHGEIIEPLRPGIPVIVPGGCVLVRDVPAWHGVGDAVEFDPSGTFVQDQEEEARQMIGLVW